jgi:hypothetical protein
MFHRQHTNLLPQFLSLSASAFHITFWKDEQKFLATKATGHVTTANIRFEESSHFAQEGVASIMAKGIIEPLEVIQVENDDPE